MSAQSPDRKKLRTGLLGYRPSEVKAELASLHAQLEDLGAKLEEALRQHEATLGVLAECRAELESRIVEESERAEGNRQLVEAKLEAARGQVRDIEREAVHRQSVLSWDLHALSLERKRFIASFRSLLLEHLDRLEQEDPSEPAVRIASQNGTGG